MNFRKGVTDMKLDNIPLEERIESYKRNGFDFVSFDWSEDENVNKKYIELCKKNNIGIDDIHLLYENANDLWISENSNYIKYILKAIDDISSDDYLGKDLIIHISRTLTPPTFSQIGVHEVIALNNYAKSKDIRLCFENLKRPDYLISLLEISDINICLDIGHANIYMENYYKFIEKYSKRIITNHLHDNMGDADSHFGLYKGNIDWNKFFDCIKKTSCDKLHLECFPENRQCDKNEFEKFVKENFLIIDSVH